MPDPSITGLRVLRAVTDTGSFTAAAETLGYTQSAVSKQMHTLELATGTVLFRRTPRGVELTVAGQVLASRSATVLNELDAASRELSGLSNEISGKVALGAFPTAAMRLVPLVIKQLRLDHPDLTLEFQEASSPTQLGRLRAGSLDVAIVAVGTGLADYDFAGLRTDEIAGGPLMIAVPEDHPFARARWVPVADLEDQPWIVGGGARDDPQFGAWPTLVSPHIAFTVRDWPTRFGFVEARLGITTIPAIASTSVPRGIRTVRVDDPSWKGRHSVVATRDDRSDATALVANAVALTAAQLHASD
ncbi:LysR family transcriptional regulator [Glaciihabitans sp. UYNi722]|uniref:LysR family transcriptional regulator n=1 Tax=Glaciihabitans sp. UYNi722 TaxID=3156344 RepID=UPI003396253C